MAPLAVARLPTADRHHRRHEKQQLLSCAEELGDIGTSRVSIYVCGLGTWHVSIYVCVCGLGRGIHSETSSSVSEVE